MEWIYFQSFLFVELTYKLPPSRHCPAIYSSAFAERCPSILLPNLRDG